MKKRTFACLLLAVMLLGMLSACGTDETASTQTSAAVSVTEAPPAETPAPTPEPVPVEPDEPSVQEPAAPDQPTEASTVEEAAPAGPCTVTFSDGQTFEATVGEDFVFFFQCDAPGDMGEPAEGEEGAGITASDGTVTYSNVGLGGPYSYPTSEKVTISGFTGDFDVTITEAATNMGATYTIYTDEQEIADAIAFAEAMAAQQAANPMP